MPLVNVSLVCACYQRGRVVEAMMERNVDESNGLMRKTTITGS